MRGTWFVLAALAGCGGDSEVVSSFEIVGHTDLGARGMNSALAIAGDTAYVGSRIDQKPILIVDISVPETPSVVAEIPGSLGMSSRELRVAGDVLIVMNLLCSPQLHGCVMGTGTENLELYDITNRRAPALLATYPVAGSRFFPRSPHEFYLWRGATTLVFLASPGAAPTLEVIDVTDARNPTRVVGWDPRMAGLVTNGEDDILHSVSLSTDGTRAYLSHQLSGLLVADVASLPAISLVTPPAAAYDWAPPGAMGPHSTVQIPGRDAVIVTEEVYPMPYGAGCPWGHLRTVDVSDPAAPKLLAEVKIAENDPAICATTPARTAFTAHNATVTNELALVTWYAGGLVAIDVRDPAKPAIVAELRPTPLASVAVEDPGLGGNAVEMWSYPIVKDGLIYVTDVRNGLYVLRYRGVGEKTLAAETFLEGEQQPVSKEEPFDIPDDFRAFMQRVISYVDTPGEQKFLDAEDALQDDTGYGGRIDADNYKFTYITRDGLYKWELPLKLAAVRDISDGLLIEVMGVRHDIVRTKQRMPSGEPLLVWGEFVDDSLSITSDDQFLAAIDGLHTASFDGPRMLRVWSATDDQCVGVINKDLCALYVVESIDGYGTSTGDRTRNDSFEVEDHEGKSMLVPWAECIPWEVARRALLHFVNHGELGQEIVVDGRIPSVLLMMGDIDRKAALASRGEAPSEIKRSSITKITAPFPNIITIDEVTAPHEIAPPLRQEELSAWAKRLIEVLYQRALIELGNDNMDEITYQLGGLLQAHGTEAQDSIDTAEWLANEIGSVRGIAKLFATGGDLQLALRRSRYV